MKKVADILAGKQRELISVAPSHTVLDALKIMSDYHQLLEHHDSADENDAVEICPQVIRTHGTVYERIIVDGLIALFSRRERK